MASRSHHRPSLSDPASFDRREGGADPAAISQAAHDSAHALVEAGRSAGDPDLTSRFVRLAETEGIDAVAELWSHSSAHSLVSSLWRIYALRTAVHASPSA
ncbi:hypothetical protein [Nesterenkonia pannonica]|uniref:hypothetical protein n=1 Tax=Nesterenkonia pannonica TaxID=1548602 RepID=UPI0021641402|nr:hypothetical protein [Nesterenkonia pannonica]